MLVASKHCGILAKLSDRWYYLSAFAINPRCPFSAKHDRRKSIITGDQLQYSAAVAHIALSACDSAVIGVISTEGSPGRVRECS
jgi:hypothetical protein